MSLSYVRKYDIDDFGGYEYSRNRGYEEYNEFDYEIYKLKENFKNVNYSKLLVLMISKFDLVYFFRLTKMCESDRNKFLLKKNVNVNSSLKENCCDLYDYSGIVLSFLYKKTLNNRIMLINEMIETFNKYVSYTQRLFVIKNHCKLISFNFEWENVSRKIKLHKTYGKVVPVEFLVKRVYYMFFNYKKKDNCFVTNGNIKGYIREKIIISAKIHNLKFLQIKNMDIETNKVLPEVILPMIKCYL